MKKIKLKISAKQLKEKMNLKDGYTPRKGVDYFDGVPGKSIKGDKGDTPVVDTSKIALEASNMAYNELLPKIPTIDQLKTELPPDTRLQIVEKINTGKKDDLKIQTTQIDGLEKYKTTKDFDFAFGVLDQRTQFLINKPATNLSAYSTKSQADTYYYPLSTNPAGYLTAETDPLSWLKATAQTGLTGDKTGTFNLLTTGTLGAGAITGTSFTDGTATLSGGNLTGMGNITGTDVDLGLGTGHITTTGSVLASAHFVGSALNYGVIDLDGGYMRLTYGSGVDIMDGGSTAHLLLASDTADFYATNIQTTGTISNLADNSKHAFGAAGTTDSYLQYTGSLLDIYAVGGTQFTNSVTINAPGLSAGDTFLKIVDSEDGIGYWAISEGTSTDNQFLATFDLRPYGIKGYGGTFQARYSTTDAGGSQDVAGPGLIFQAYLSSGTHAVANVDVATFRNYATELMDIQADGDVEIKTGALRVLANNLEVGGASTGRATIAHTIPASPVANLYVGQYASDLISGAIMASSRGTPATTDNWTGYFSNSAISSSIPAGSNYVGGLYAIATSNHTSGELYGVIGLRGYAYYQPTSGTGTAARIYGLDFGSYLRTNLSTNSAATLIGANVEYGIWPTSTDGDITSAYGYRARLATGNHANAGITKAYGLFIDTSTGIGTLGTEVGIWINDVVLGATKYGIVIDSDAVGLTLGADQDVLLASGGAGVFNFSATAADTDLTFNFAGTTTSGQFLWDEDNDWFQFTDDIALGASASNNVFSTSTHGDGSTVMYIGNSTINVTEFSDIRTKENITATQYGISDLMQLSVKDFMYKKEYVNDGAEQRQRTGLIAQEVENVYPEAMIYRSDGFIAIDYAKMIPLIIKSMQDLQVKMTGGEPISLNSSGSMGTELISGIFSQSIKQSLMDIGMTLIDGMATLKEIAVDKFTAKTARMEKIEMVDSETGNIYCTWIQNGEWQKAKGECGSVAVAVTVEELKTIITLEPAPVTPEVQPSVSTEEIIQQVTEQVAQQIAEPIEPIKK